MEPPVGTIVSDMLSLVLSAPCAPKGALTCCCTQRVPDILSMRWQVIAVEHDAHGVDCPEDVPKIEELMRKKGIA